VDAAELILWAVSIPIGDDSPQPNLEELNSGDKKKPFPGEEMQEAFPEPLPKKYVHVIVKPPTMYVILTVLSIRTFCLPASDYLFLLFSITPFEDLSNMLICS